MGLVHLNHKQTTWSWNLNIFKTKCQCKSKDFKSGSSKQVHQVVSMEGTLKDTPEIQKKVDHFEVFLWPTQKNKSWKGGNTTQIYQKKTAKKLVDAKNWWMIIHLLNFNSNFMRGFSWALHIYLGHGSLQIFCRLLSKSTHFGLVKQPREEVD